MALITRNLKIYYAAVGLLALWVGAWGYFNPTQVDKAIPWLVPPFHARFIGAIYLSGLFMMGSAFLARWYDEVRIPTILAAIWTGSLFIVSLFHLGEFDFSRTQVWFWFGAYIAYPILGFWIVWSQRDTHSNSSSPILPGWIRTYLFAQGLFLTALALALFLLPEFMLTIWPWKISRMLAQIYSGPFLAYGVGSLMLSRQRTWPQVRIVTAGMVVLAIGILLASIIHRSAFTALNLSTFVWFGGFSIAAIINLSAILRHKKNVEG